MTTLDYDGARSELARINDRFTRGDNSGGGWLFELHNLRQGYAMAVARCSAEVLRGNTFQDPVEAEWEKHVRLWIEIEDLEEQILTYVERLSSTR